MNLLSVEPFYTLIGLAFGWVGLRVAFTPGRSRRWGSGLFWIVLGVSFGAGKFLSPVVDGALVLALVVLAAAGQVPRPAAAAGRRAERQQQADRLGNRIFWPVLLVPACAVVGSILFSRLVWHGLPWADGAQGPLIALGVGAVLAVAAGLRTTGAPGITPVAEGSRLLESIGWTLVLPQLLAALGGIFAKAGVGAVVADLTARALPTQVPVVAVAAYCLGMALFTICLGNAFAAFAVITGGLGLPLIVHQHGGNPAIMAAMGMLAGYCGTLVTPMAAYFNLVPAILLELDDRYAVIKAQAPIALVVFLGNLGLMYFCVYRF